MKVSIALGSIDDILLELQNIQTLMFFCPRQALRTFCLLWFTPTDNKKDRKHCVKRQDGASSNVGCSGQCIISLGLTLAFGLDAACCLALFSPARSTLGCQQLGVLHIIRPFEHKKKKPTFSKSIKTSSELEKEQVCVCV